MAHLILTSKGRETGRRQLAGPLTIGRAPDCDLAVRDILLSRHHCRIEPAGRGWVVVDLGSKNGTWLDGQRVGRRGLRYGDELRAGKTIFRLVAGDLPAESAGRGSPGADESQRATTSRPADPFEALAGTVAGAVFDPTDFEPAGGRPERARRPINRFPTPRPMPPEPAAYARDDVYSMLSEIASSSWDSIYANASQPIRPAPRVILPAGTEPGGGAVAGVGAASGVAVAPRRQPAPSGGQDPRTAERRARRRRAQVDLALQVPVEYADRPARPVRPPFPVPSPVDRPRDARKLVRRGWQWVARVLMRVRSGIAPRGAVMLF